MVISGVVLYSYTRWLLNNEIEEELYSNKDRVEHLLETSPEIIGVAPIMMAEKAAATEANILIDTLIYDPLQDEVELFRQLSGTKIINGQNYKITVRAMVIEADAILYGIVFTFMTIIFLGFIFLYFFNEKRNQKLWKPFFVNLGRVKLFSIKSDKTLKLMQSDILEFHELNQEMESLTNKIQVDYRNLKQFTEDVSHEMQTPLAIMQAKIETVINESDINENQFERFSSLQEDIQRLKQLNKKLILLAKIDNDQFTATEVISINSILKQSIENFEELSDVCLEMTENAVFNVRMDRTLAMVLCNNLLSNAIKHTIGLQPVEIIINKNSIQIINNGTTGLDRPEQLFNRFYKESKKPDSTGLGLSIVKKVCDYYNFNPSYLFRESEQQHVFQVDFNLKANV
uniref:sensor histidine kinase n=1 Tax=Nonlabens antarcticus TaxID=392714 RepID=UPI001890DB02|nr:HAMP domain-containing sensor histidine kinase [Nonlabens antarcticus]